MTVALDSSLALLQTGIIVALQGDPAAAMAAAAVTTAVSDVAKQFLSPREGERLQTVVSLAIQQIAARRAEGTEPRTDLDPSQLTELLDGTLHAAKDSYEAKKLPLLANLLAAAPFTGTPLVNLVGSLYLAESLTYRQLCILAVLKPYEPWPGPELTTDNIETLMGDEPLTESKEGILQDLLHLMSVGLVRGPTNLMTITATGDVSPATLQLTYQARLLHNGMRLQTVPTEDLTEILAVLGAVPAGE